MHAGGQGGSNKQKEKKKKSFQHKTPQNKETRALTLAPHWARPICFVPSYLPLPSEGEPLGAILGPSSLPWPPFSPQPLKSCTAMCTALMFALYPTCKAIIIHASWQSQALSLLHLQLFALGYDMTVRLISPLLHIAPCVSLPLCFSALRLCTVFESHSDLTTWKVFYLSSPCDTSVALMRLAVSPDNSRCGRAKNAHWCSTHVSSQVCFVQECFSHHFSSLPVKSNQTTSVLGI